ncbi:MAG TPA: T6SS effector BTH_I2691 family protein [Dyella sp.]|uniref:T6SS effector BTH_I2691 family protein n=1 Tax=Dyella sp. TaxID=1869338 RepID=UPI002CB07DFF|nr:T6SS effector BTH_I2691 family protein [Dyella sp.]HTV85407.1 T6SS effector BTH_I2691 family protein [Dyella sp.]
MATWNELFAQCDANRSVIERLMGSGPAVTCKPTFSFLPLRYAAVTGDTQALKALPSLPGNLRRPQQVRKLTQSAYAVRPLREGFLYVLAKRVGTYQWEGQFRVDANGTLTYVVADKPWETAALDFQNLSNLRWSIALHDLDGIDELRVLFSPDPLTPAMLDRYQKQPTYRNAMQPFDIRQLAYSCVDAPDSVLTRDQFNLIADVAGEQASALATLLDTQAFPRAHLPMAAVRAAMAPAPGHTEDRGVALVLDDALGIAQELNAWRNRSVQLLEDYLRKSSPGDDKGVDNHRKLTIAFAIDNLKKTLAEQAEQQYLDSERNIGVVYSDPGYSSGNAQVAMMSGGTYRTYRNPADQAAKQSAKITQLRHDSWDGKYAKYVDEDRRRAFLADYQKAVAEADAIKEARSTDHLAWLTSHRLQDALLAYDRHDTEHGLYFECQLGMAMVGMNACKDGNGLLSGWTEGSVAPTNLAWRALAQNQEATEQEIDKLLAQRRQLVNLSESQWDDTIKNLTAIFDKSRATVEAFEAVSGHDGPGAKRLAGGVLLTNALGNRLFESEVASLLDAPTNVVLAWVFKARLGRFAQQMHLEARGGVPLSNGVITKITGATSESFTKALKAGVKGPMAELRVASALTVLEAWNFKIKAQKADKGSREYLELMAATMAVSAASLEFGGAAVGLAERSGNLAVRQAATIFKSGLRLNAGILCGTAALVGAAFDVKDSFAIGADYSKNWADRLSLSGAYALRATAQVGSGAFAFGLGLANGAPFLRYMAEKYAQVKWVDVAADHAARLALRELFMLRWCIRINVAIFVLSVIIEYMLPNDLETYLDHCTFCKNRSNGLAESEAKEVEIFVRAVENTL